MRQFFSNESNERLEELSKQVPDSPLLVVLELQTAS